MQQKQENCQERDNNHPAPTWIASWGGQNLSWDTATSQP